MKTAPGFEHDRKDCLPTKSSRLFPFGFDKNKPFGYLFRGCQAKDRAPNVPASAAGGEKIGQKGDFSWNRVFLK